MVSLFSIHVLNFIIYQLIAKNRPLWRIVGLLMRGFGQYGAHLRNLSIGTAFDNGNLRKQIIHLIKGGQNNDYYKNEKPPQLIRHA